MHKPDLSYRADIDGLRAVAILAVMGYHFCPRWVSGGFVGVDIFFVLSGYLISQILLKSFEHHSFSFNAFYIRRIRRIFPALIVVVTAVAATSLFTLTNNEQLGIAKHVMGAASFSTNFILWSESDYFDAAIATKPLMHLWSLGVEEQFYLLWPLTLWLLRKKPASIGAAIIAILCISFAWNIDQTFHNGVAAFYSPLTRFWELMVGSLLAYYAPALPSAREKKPFYHQALSVGGCVMLGVSPFIIDNGQAWPGFGALLPVCGAAFAIAAGPASWINRKILAQPLLRKLGLISYPLYLWHWPLLSYAKMLNAGKLSVFQLWVIAATSLFLAIATYVVVEKPLRFGSSGKNKALCLVVVMFALGWFGLCRIIYDGNSFYTAPIKPFSVESWPYWSNPLCINRYHASPCQISSPTPKLMILGDSHANHLFPGFAFGNPKIPTLSVGTCPPFDQVYLRNTGFHGDCDGVNSLAVNQAILKNTPSIKTVILSANWDYVFMQDDDDKRKNGVVNLVSTFPGEENLDNMALLNNGLARTISYLQAQGLNVAFMRKTPSSPIFDLLSYCNLRRIAETTRQDCAITKSEYLDSRHFEDIIVDRLKERFPNLVIYDPLNAMCDDDRCYLMKHGILYFRDGHHLSETGSRLIADDFKHVLISHHFDIE